MNNDNRQNLLVFCLSRVRGRGEGGMVMACRSAFRLEINGKLWDACTHILCVG